MSEQNLNHKSEIRYYYEIHTTKGVERNIKTEKLRSRNERNMNDQETRTKLQHQEQHKHQEQQ